MSENKELRKINEAKVKKPNEAYLGNNVYAIFDGEGIILRSSDIKDPSDQIYIEDAIYIALVKFADKMFEKMEVENG